MRSVGQMEEPKSDANTHAFSFLSRYCLYPPKEFPGTPASSLCFVWFSVYFFFCYSSCKGFSSLFLVVESAVDCFLFVCVSVADVGKGKVKGKMDGCGWTDGMAGG